MAAMSQEEFLLKWNDHHASFFTIVEDLCRSELLCDVTLACGGQVFETHRLVLCVCSPYFRALLTARPDKHPIVYLKDVNPKHLEQLLSYMYRGEINVLQDDLGPLIETARGLQIKGLADAGGSGNSDSGKKEKSSSNGDSRPSQPAVKRSRTATPTPVSSGKAARLDGGGKMNHSAAAAAAMDNKSFRVGQVTVNPPTPSVHQADMFVGDEEEDEAGIVDSEVKQEMWVATGGEDGDDYEDIPPEQYEQELQAEDEQYIQAGQDTAQQGNVAQKPVTPSADDDRGVSPPSAPHAPGTSPPLVSTPSPGVSPPSPWATPPASEAPFPAPMCCNICGKEFHVPSLLERHQRSHTNERPYRCQVCGRGYSQSGNLNVHLKTIHGVVSETTRSRAEPEGLRPHRCYICTRMFTTSSNMYQHIRAVHNVMIETAKSPRSSPSPFSNLPFPSTAIQFSQATSSRPSPVLSSSRPPPSLIFPSNTPRPSPAPALDHWHKVKFQQLQSLATEQSLPPAPKPRSATPQGGHASGSRDKNKRDATIQDTLQQLSALAGGAGSDQVDRKPMFLLDQDKPITPSATGGDSLKNLAKYCEKGAEDSSEVTVKQEK